MADPQLHDRAAPQHKQYAWRSWSPVGIKVLEHSALSRLAGERRLSLLLCSGATLLRVDRAARDRRRLGVRSRAD